MNNKKVFLVVFVAVILALLVALLFVPKENKSVDSVKEDILFENINVKQEDEKDLPKVEKHDIAEQVQTPRVEASKPVSNSNDKKYEPVFEDLKLEEPSKVEEAVVAFDDVGIINDNGAIVVTRPFKVKSPDKYSFVGFGEQKAPVK